MYNSSSFFHQANLISVMAVLHPRICFGNWMPFNHLFGTYIGRISSSLIILINASNSWPVICLNLVFLGKLKKNDWVVLVSESFLKLSSYAKRLSHYFSQKDWRQVPESSEERNCFKRYRLPSPNGNMCNGKCSHWC